MTVEEGSSQAFTIGANTGYELADVLVDGASIGAVSSYTFENVTADHTISASFNETAPPPPPTQYTLAVQTAGAGTGSVALDPAGGVYDEGTLVTLTATTDAGSEFVEWSGDLAGSANPETITMDADKIVNGYVQRYRPHAGAGDVESA